VLAPPRPRTLPENPFMFNKMTTSKSDTTTGSLRSLKSIDTGKRSKSPSSYRKKCDLCHTPSDVLVRCRIDDTLNWHFVCTSKCWKEVSGGVVDGPDKPYYVYGGMWKNKHAGVSAKKPKGKTGVHIEDWNAYNTRYVTNDKVRYSGRIWVCRKSHQSSETKYPGVDYALWKEDEQRNRVI